MFYRKPSNRYKFLIVAASGNARQFDGTIREVARYIGKCVPHHEMISFVYVIAESYRCRDIAGLYCRIVASLEEARELKKKNPTTENAYLKSLANFKQSPR